MGAWSQTQLILAICKEHASVVCSDDLEQEQLSLVIINAKKFLSVPWNCTQWLNMSPNPLYPFATGANLQAFGQVHIPDDVQSANML